MAGGHRPGPPPALLGIRSRPGSSPPISARRPPRRLRRQRDAPGAALLVGPVAGPPLPAASATAPTVRGPDPGGDLSAPPGTAALAPTPALPMGLRPGADPGPRRSLDAGDVAPGRRAAARVIPAPPAALVPVA